LLPQTVSGFGVAVTRVALFAVPAEITEGYGVALLDLHLASRPEHPDKSAARTVKLVFTFIAR